MGEKLRNHVGDTRKRHTGKPEPGFKPPTSELKGVCAKHSHTTLTLVGSIHWNHLEKGFMNINHNDRNPSLEDSTVLDLTQNACFKPKWLTDYTQKGVFLQIL